MELRVGLSVLLGLHFLRRAQGLGDVGKDHLGQHVQDGRGEAVRGHCLCLHGQGSLRSTSGPNV